MKFSVDIQSLVKAAGEAVTDGKSIPAYAHCRIVADGEAVTLTSTDGEVSREDRISCAVQAPGAATCDPQLLRAGLAGLSGEAQVSIDTGRVKIKHARGALRLASIDAEAMPIFDARGDVLAEAAADDVLAAMLRVAYCVNTKDPRFWARGVYVTANEVVAASGPRMATVRIDTGLPDMLIPIGAVQQLRALSGGTLHAIGDGDNAFACEARTPTARVRTTLIAERFPDVRNALSNSRQNQGTARFSTQAAAAALGRLVPLSDRAVDFEIDIEVRDNRLVLALPKGAGEEHIDATLEGSAGIAVTINARYLLDTLRLGGAETIWWFANVDSAQIFTFPDRDGELHVIMPRRRS